MNKSERDALARIVAGMIYSFDSTTQLVEAGHELLKTFPSITDDVNHYRYAVSFYNVLNCIRSSAAGLYDINIMGKKSQDLRMRTHEDLESIFDEYITLFAEDKLFEIAEQLGKSESTKAENIVNELFQSPEWQAAAAGVYDIESAEFAYVTNKKGRRSEV